MMTSRGAHFIFENLPGLSCLEYELCLLLYTYIPLEHSITSKLLETGSVVIRLTRLPKAYPGTRFTEAVKGYGLSDQ